MQKVLWSVFIYRRSDLLLFI